MTDGTGTQRVKFERKYCPKCYAQFEREVVCPNDGTELRGQDNDPFVGKVFAERYEIQSVLGLGGMSIVYKAQHKLMNRVVAIKMLHNNIKNDKTSLERFRTEAQAASSLNHQNIITVYDFGVSEEGDAFFVMDFLDGENLADLIHRKDRVPWERALPIFKQICDGLGAAHKKSIVHRDLKPANVVLLKQEDGSELVKLVDFGIAKLLPASGKEDQHLTKTGEVFGSPVYMSPEQCQGLPLDRRSDIYALGCLMYETLAGVPPLLGNNFLETLNMHVSDTPKSFSENAPGVKLPDGLEQIIFRCIAKSPDDRFQTTDEIRDLLSAISAATKSGNTGINPAILSGPMTAAPCPKSKKKQLVLTVALTAAIAIIGGGAGIFFIWPGPPDDRGTPATKMIWSMHLSEASDQAAKGNYEAAEKALNDAEALARTLTGGGKARLEVTLKQKADLYTKWEGHAELLEKALAEVASLQTDNVINEMKKQLASLEKLEFVPLDSAVAQTNAKLRAEAELPSILSTAGKLDGRKRYLEKVKFLDKALAVMKKLLGADSVSVVKLETAQADGYVGLRNFPAVRPLLVHACDVYEKSLQANPEAYVRALSKLGQFDLDQNRMKLAEPELKKALDLGKEKKVPYDLQILLLRSWADLLNQTNRQKESQDILKEASTLEQLDVTEAP